MAARLSVDLSPHLLTMRFRTSIDLSTKLRELVADESECCGFVDWEPQDRGDELRPIVRGNPEGVLAIAESFGATL